MIRHIFHYSRSVVMLLLVPLPRILPSTHGFLVVDYQRHHQQQHSSLSLPQRRFLVDHFTKKGNRVVTTKLTVRPPDFTVVDGDDDGNHNSYEEEEEDDSLSLATEGRRDRGRIENNEEKFEETSFSLDGDVDDQQDFDYSSRPRRRGTVLRGGRTAPMSGASWMQRNNAFTGSSTSDSDDDGDDGFLSNGQDTRQRRGRSNFDAYDNNKSGGSVRTFRQDFRGTRVFVQGLPPQATWQDVKDHFRQHVGDGVVFASVSSDPKTGKSKGCGIVQFETTEMALTAIAIMRNYPMDGSQLFVREDIQESSSNQDRGSGGRLQPKKGPTPPSKWKCADEAGNAEGYFSDEELKTIRSLIKARDDARRRRQYDASDNIREELKYNYGVHLDDRLQMWWTSSSGDNAVPQAIREVKGEGRWGALQPWRQIPTTPENDACVNPDLVNGLLKQRDIARKEKDFRTADALLDEARNSPDGDLSLRIHDESRTWRIWTDEPPPELRSRSNNVQRSNVPRRSAEEQCLDLAQEFAPDRVEEIRTLLDKFPGREYLVLKKLKKRYLQNN